MTANELLTEELPPLKDTDTAEKALRWMEEFKVSHLPIVKGTQYLGLISDNDLYDLEDENIELKALQKTLPRPFIFEDAHVYEVMRLISELKISVVPILDHEERFLGSTNLLYLMSLITEIGSLKETGGIIVLEMNVNDYMLSQIAQIVESNNAKILSSYITSAPDSTMLEVTIKISTTRLDAIIQTFMRYDYNVKASYQKGEFYDNLKRRYDELMLYIKM